MSLIIKLEFVHMLTRVLNVSNLFKEKGSSLRSLKEANNGVI